MDICRCCGRPGPLTRVDGGDMHLDCWLEHHSDPTGAWPPNHECARERSTPKTAPAGVDEGLPPAGAPKHEGTQEK